MVQTLFYVDLLNFLYFHARSFFETFERIIDKLLLKNATSIYFWSSEFFSGTPRESSRKRVRIGFERVKFSPPLSIRYTAIFGTKS